MNGGTAVANSSPLIALDQIQGVWLLRELFPTVLVPPAVQTEVQSVSLPAWVEVRSLAGVSDPRIPATPFGRGEREVISLGLEIGAHALILDDLPARRLAERLGLRVVGTLGVLLLAKQRRLVPAIRPLLDALRAAGFFFDERLYWHLLALAGE